MFNKLSRMIGFTVTEIKVFLFLAVSLLIGVGYQLYKESDPGEPPGFNYKQQDSIFNSLTDSSSQFFNEETVNKNIDSKEEVLDFRSEDFIKNKKEPLPGEKSIDINSADLNSLKRLPGIGEKTANNIIKLRTERKGFKNLEELLDVRGIGESKFSKIEKFLYIGKSF